IPMVLPPSRLEFGYTFVALDPDGHRIRLCATDTSGIEKL
ncbi:phenazine biosynthesis protein, partial [Escherichia coli]